MCESVSAASQSMPTAYFIMKCADVASLQQCIQSNEWACRRRNKQPHPYDMLASAHDQGSVVLIFSVNSQHGWHGFCQSCFKIKPDTCPSGMNVHTQPVANTSVVSDIECQRESSTISSGCPNDLVEQDNTWHHFPVQWLVHYQKFNTYSCLDFKYTDHLKLSDGSPINKARNWQELPCDAGEELCNLMKDHYAHLTVLEQKQQALKNKKPESFFKGEQDISVLKENETWQAVIAKITKELGKVHLACPFGSQRYQLLLAFMLLVSNQSKWVSHNKSEAVVLV